jgi:hypothetical protein
VSLISELIRRSERAALFNQDAAKRRMQQQDQQMLSGEQQQQQKKKKKKKKKKPYVSPADADNRQLQCLKLGPPAQQQQQQEAAEGASTLSEWPAGVFQELLAVLQQAQPLLEHLLVLELHGLSPGQQDQVRGVCMRALGIAGDQIHGPLLGMSV